MMTKTMTATTTMMMMMMMMMILEVKVKHFQLHSSVHVCLFRLVYSWGSPSPQPCLVESSSLPTAWQLLFIDTTTRIRMPMNQTTISTILQRATDTITDLG